jgi:hypothetical protein
MTAVCRSSLVCALLVVAAIDAGGVALAQKPSQAQINAMRQSCRSDYMAHCSTVPTGGAPALNCLKQNLSNLSPACQSAVKAIASDTAVAAASSTPTAPAAPASSAPPSTPAAPAVAAPPATGQPTSAGTSKPSQVQLRNVRQACGADYRNTLWRYSAGRFCVDRLSEAQRKNFVRSVPAGTGRRRGRYQRSCPNVAATAA